ncbi:MAG: ABC transporter substrate-binding protein [Ilumatobacteraceae bacterium]
MTRRRARLTACISLSVSLALLVASCGSSSPSPASTSPASTSPADSAATSTSPASSAATGSDDVVAGAAFPAARCAANKAAGKITYLTGFDYSASASMVDVFVADAAGYFTDLCLDVEIKPSLSTDNYPLVAANHAQFASAGSFSEVVEFNQQNKASLKALAVEGRVGIDTLIVKHGAITSLADVRGKKIGVKAAITRSVKAMLLEQGLVENKDYDTVQLDGYDPMVHLATPGIIGFPGYKSNEPLQLKAAGAQFDTYDPADYGIPGSFGVIVSDAAFIAAHPTAATDFMRATMRGLHDALADPTAAANVAVGLINAHGNAMSLSPAGEIARWAVESKIVAANSTAAFPAGVPEPQLLTKELTSYAKIGMFNGQTPDYTSALDPLLATVYAADGSVIWPSK